MTEDKFENMSEEESRARAEAAALGQATILEVAVAALLKQVTHPDLVVQAMALRLGELEEAEPSHPGLAWAPPQIHEGAKAAATRILAISGFRFPPKARRN